MKTPKQWQEELSGETSIQAIRAIQTDALVHAMTVMTNYKQSRADAVSELAIEIEKNVNAGE